MKKILVLTLLLSSFVFGGEVNWVKDYESALKTSKSSDKPIFMLVESENCFFCKELKRKTLSKERVISMLNNNYVPLKVMQDDGSYPDTFAVRGTPTMFFISGTEKEYMRPLLGYANEFKMMKKLTGGYE